MNSDKTQQDVLLETNFFLYKDSSLVPFSCIPFVDLSQRLISYQLSYWSALESLENIILKTAFQHLTVFDLFAVVNCGTVFQALDCKSMERVFMPNNTYIFF